MSVGHSKIHVSLDMNNIPLTKNIPRERKVNFLDLHEDIFRRIFRNLEDETVYFVMRSICRKIKAYVDAYIQLEDMAMFAAGPGMCSEYMPTELIYVFKRSDKTFSICYKFAKP